MYRAKVRSERTDHPEEGSEEFFIDRPTLDQAIAALMLSELDEVCDDWFNDVEGKIRQLYTVSGFSFTLLDQGSNMLYTYSFVPVTA